MIKQLASLANRLDKLGQYGVSDEIDNIIRLAVEEWKYHGFQSEKDYDEFLELRGKKKIKDVVKEEPKPMEMKNPSMEPAFTTTLNKIFIQIMYIAKKYNLFRCGPYRRDIDKQTVSVEMHFDNDVERAEFVRDVETIMSFEGMPDKELEFEEGVIWFEFPGGILRLVVFLHGGANEEEVSEKLDKLIETMNKYF